MFGVNMIYGALLQSLSSQSVSKHIDTVVSIYCIIRHKLIIWYQFL